MEGIWQPLGSIGAFMTRRGFWGYSIVYLYEGTLQNRVLFIHRLGLEGFSENCIGNPWVGAKFPSPSELD